MTRMSETLKEYHLPKNVLPMAPQRKIFFNVSVKALQYAADLSITFPEKRGVLSHCVRSLADIPSIHDQENTVTIEAHFDSVQIPLDLVNVLYSLGFENDGFHKFNPAHYQDHYTLKFKVQSENVKRRKEVMNFLQDSKHKLLKYIVNNHPRLECYLEIEIYSDKNKVSWKNQPPYYDTLEVPFDARMYRSIDMMCSQPNLQSATAKHVVKRADIHAKFDRRLSSEQRSKLLVKFSNLGFYDVITWAGNTVCTAQFSEVADAKKVFRQMLKYFSKFGGISELTFEPAPFFWRSKWTTNNIIHYASVPPVLVRNRL